MVESYFRCNVVLEDPSYKDFLQMRIIEGVTKVIEDVVHKV